ncbi:MAG: arginine--tRNA ligase, partial [Candidatus Blackburnbacteria bacterium]|nr:arginine--tRNA ligase [Candidatus Blackburnbacteria bacterium]
VNRQTENRNPMPDKLNTEEEDILRTFYKFPEIVQEAAENYAPNLLCNFLFELAQKYNAFYNRHRILEAENQEFRLALTEITGNILQSGLGLLGIDAPERM